MGWFSKKEQTPLFNLYAKNPALSTTYGDNTPAYKAGRKTKRRRKLNKLKSFKNKRYSNKNKNKNKSCKRKKCRK